jgi:hypothetical protein
MFLNREVLGSFALVLPTRRMRMDRGNGMGSKRREVTVGEKKRGKVMVVKVKK